MPYSYQQLLWELQQELGQWAISSEIAPRLPSLIRRAELIVWSDTCGLWTQQSYECNLVAGTAEQSVDFLERLLRLKELWWNGDKAVQRVPERLWSATKESATAEVELACLFVVEGRIEVARPPSEDGTLTVIGVFRDELLTTDSTDENSRLLRYCPELVKLMALMQVADNRFPIWQRQYDRVLRGLRASWTGQQETNFRTVRGRRLLW